MNVERWIEDKAAKGSLLSSLERRVLALRLGGVLLAFSFLAIFIPCVKDNRTCHSPTQRSGS